jgi:8-oxo-dGTP pyrophosphatase MutT (NUDIX family)
MDMTCINCNKRGHIVRTCTNPITSFGIIAVKKSDKNITNRELDEILASTKEIYTAPQHRNDTRLLMIQRKDTIGFTDFIRGKYTKDDPILKTYFSEMTVGEQARILTETFDQLWNKLWVNHKCRTFKNEYECARKKFYSIDRRLMVELYPAVYEFQEFGFPKGRKNGRENDVACAQREFTEETGYRAYDYTFMDYPPIVEEFIGTDNVQYRHVYYLVRLSEHARDPVLDLSNMFQACEIRNIGMFSMYDCLRLIRPYDVKKKEMIKKLSMLL